MWIEPTYLFLASMNFRSLGLEPCVPTARGMHS
jgi:hypothetical protein